MNVLNAKRCRTIRLLGCRMQEHAQQNPSDAQARGPASPVIAATMVAGMAVTSLMAVEYTWEPSGAPEALKKAPFRKMSPDDTQFQLRGSPSPPSCNLLLTCNQVRESQPYSLHQNSQRTSLDGPAVKPAPALTSLLTPFGAVKTFPWLTIVGSSLPPMAYIPQPW